MEAKKKDEPTPVVPGKDPVEKASVGGKYNSGVTSSDPDEKKEIEKKGTMKETQPQSDKEKHQDDYKNYMTKEDIPDSTNESTGVPGSGQRQDTN